MIDSMFIEIKDPKLKNDEGIASFITEHLKIREPLE
jgi:hypothetical protein